MAAATPPTTPPTTPPATGGNPPQQKKGQQQQPKPRCWSCNKELPNETDRGCRFCGTVLENECPNCTIPDPAHPGQTLKLKTRGRFCSNCVLDIMPKPTTTTVKLWKLKTELPVGSAGASTFPVIQTEDGKQPKTPKMIGMTITGNGTVQCYDLGGGQVLFTDEPAGRTPCAAAMPNNSGVLTCRSEFGSAKKIYVVFFIPEDTTKPIHLHGGAAKVEAVDTNNNETLMGFFGRMIKKGYKRDER